jgi:dihydroflavonol-4-reductase
LINSPKKNEMILITGATGFLGSALVHQLTTQGKQVRALKRERSAVPALLQNNNKIEWYITDILDLATLEDAFEGIDQVYHCAAFVSFDPKDKKKLLSTNIEGTSNIVNLCLANEVRLIHVSSVAALGNMTPKYIVMPFQSMKGKWKSGAELRKVWKQ